MKVRKIKNDDLVTRSLRLRVNAEGRPESIDKDKRIIEIIVATETDTVRVWDWELGLVPEILLMSGCRAVDQVPLLDTHSRESVSKVLGSVRDFRIDGTDQLGVARYSTVKEADDAFTKTDEGHLTDYSAGYRHLATTSVAEGETVSLGGRSFTGPCLVVTDWELKEVSTCPIGADNRAKARALDSNNQEEEIMLKEFLRKKRAELGLAEDATEDQVRAAIDEAIQTAKRASASAAPAPAPAAPAAPAPANLEDQNRQAVADERARAAEITALCEAHDCRDLAAVMLKDGTTVAEAQRTVLDHLKKRTETPSPGFRVEVGTTGGERARPAIVDCLLMRSGIVVEKPDPGARDFMGHNLRELARESLVLSGHSVPGHLLDMVGRALTTSDLPNILGNVANRSLMAGFEAAEETYEVFCDTTGSLTDFKQADLARRGEVSNLQEVKEGGEYKYGITSDTKEVVKLATYGEIIAISRQAIINDDLGSLTDIPKEMGEAVSRLLGDLAYGVLIANSAMSDGKALFHTDHGNLAGSGASVDVTPLSAAEKAMGLQKDLLGKRRLNIKPQFFIGPLSIKGVVEQFFKTDKIGGAANKPNLANIYFGDYFNRVYDARLDDDSATAWYLAAAKGKTVKLFFLNGMKTPYMEQKAGWSVDGVEFKVRMDAAAKALAWTGLYKNPGA